MSDMIRINGTASGRRIVLLIIPPDKVKLMRAGKPVAVDVQRGHPDIVSEPLDVIIHAPTTRNLAKMARSIAGEARTQGIEASKVRRKKKQR